VDRHVLRLIKMWLRAPIEERGGDGKRRIVGGGKGNSRGTPQGGVVSPLLANIYMNRFLKHWRRTGCGEALCAHVVAYADDFVILSRGRAAEALAWTKAVMTRLGLTLNEAKTSLRDARQERFDFQRKALSQGEGGARLPLLCALRQDLPRGHFAPRVQAGPRQCGCCRRGRGELRCDRGVGRGYTDVVDADLSKYFDTIPHAELMRCVAREARQGEGSGLNVATGDGHGGSRTGAWKYGWRACMRNWSRRRTGPIRCGG
jgi:Reverse transcriptase (RNA-dependent DNA polymerase)